MPFDIDGPRLVVLDFDQLTMKCQDMNHHVKHINIHAHSYTMPVHTMKCVVILKGNSIYKRLCRACIPHTKWFNRDWLYRQKLGLISAFDDDTMKTNCMCKLSDSIWQMILVLSWVVEGQTFLLSFWWNIFSKWRTNQIHRIKLQCIIEAWSWIPGQNKWDTPFVR